MNEHHTTLYRKYRPYTFKEILGQDHIVSVLEAAIQNKSIAHAYLFSGSRGTGKTSIARIMASELGCVEEDIYEIDAASNRGIDDIRALRDSVHTLPFKSPYKIYIIDEVHMLTKDAFNALLKTLEEPPQHVIFMLATTEKDKVIDTIISRCQVFDFKRPTQSVLRDHIKNIAKKEGYTIDAGSLELISVLGDGSYRDTLGMLQKVMSYSTDKKITVDEAERITGAPGVRVVGEFLAAIAGRDIDGALALVTRTEDAGIPAKTFIHFLILRMRYLLLLRYAKNTHATIKEEIGEESYERLVAIGKEGTHINSETLKELLVAYRESNYAVMPYVPLELAVYRILEEKA